MRRDAEATLDYNAHHDPLTALRNRRALMRDLRAAEATAKGGVLFLIDLDKFKFINDTLGHAVGDQLLQEVAKRLGGVEAGLVLYRLGGDEFVGLWCGPLSEHQATGMAEALTECLSLPFRIGDHDIASGGSIGVAWLGAEDGNMADGLARADLALYEAKQRSGNSFAIYRPALAERAEQRMSLENDLRIALAEGQFRLNFQPIVSMKTQKLRGFEALLRWSHPLRGQVPPDAFIPAAEQSGLIVPIGRWVLREACMAAAKWPSPIGVAVNISAEQVKDRGFISHVRACLRESGLAPGRLTLEITENVFVIDVDLVRSVLDTLREHGITVALDDFGTGFSSIQHLRSFPIDQLKIDKSFAFSMLASNREAELVRTVVRLSKAFGMKTILEGIETDEQIAFIRDEGISELQGYFYSRPVEEANVPGLIASLAGPSSEPVPLRPVTLVQG